MADIVRQMMKDCLDSLVNLDTEMAKKVCEADDKVDDIHRSIYPLVENKIEPSQEEKKQWIRLLVISRYLERTADHCTNIAEDVDYLVKGGICRHMGNK